MESKIKYGKTASAGKKTSGSCADMNRETMLDNPDEIRVAIRGFYAQRALSNISCCGDGQANQLYPADMLSTLSEDTSSFSLGCGDPITVARLETGETVLDLGSGGGLDCFLAAKQVGTGGYVIGVDMTSEMLERACTAAEEMGITNVEFRQGYLEDLPVKNGSIDVVISNCVINLSPDKPKVFAEIFRVLKPGGRISISDIVTTRELPPEIKYDLAAWGACISGALHMEEYTGGLTSAGFTDIKLTPRDGAGLRHNKIPQGILFSVSILALKPE
ncbi:MAG: arsenite methyltransferase [Anaerolineales bacterium]